MWSDDIENFVLIFSYFVKAGLPHMASVKDRELLTGGFFFSLPTMFYHRVIFRSAELAASVITHFNPWNHLTELRN